MATGPRSGNWNRLGHFLALNRTVALVLATILFFGLGEQLWSPFLPSLLEARERTGDTATGALPASALWLISIYGLVRNLTEAVLLILGGRVNATLGDRGALLLVSAVTLTGYLLFLLVPFPAASVVAAILILGWDPLSLPTTFTAVGASVEHARQGMAFAIQSIQKRLPKILGPVIAGIVLSLAVERTGDESLGRSAGMQALFAVALALGCGAIFVQWRWMPRRDQPTAPLPLPQVFASFSSPLRRLLAAEVLARWADWMLRELQIVYVIVVLREPDYVAGILVGIQNTVSLITYIPVGQLTKTRRLETFIGWTFVCTALFPIALFSLPGRTGLVVAFAIYGLREVGDPPRKALITALFHPSVRAQGIGWYWGIRTLAIAPAPCAGAAIWLVAGPGPLLLACAATAAVAAVFFYAVFRQPVEPPPT